MYLKGVPKSRKLIYLVSTYVEPLYKSTPFDKRALKLEMKAIFSYLFIRKTGKTHENQNCAFCALWYVPIAYMLSLGMIVIKASLSTKLRHDRWRTCRSSIQSNYGYWTLAQN